MLRHGYSRDVTDWAQESKKKRIAERVPRRGCEVIGAGEVVDRIGEHEDRSIRQGDDDPEHQCHEEDHHEQPMPPKP